MYTPDEAVAMAVEAVKSLNIAEAHRRELDRAFKRGYQQAVDDMYGKLGKLFPIVPEPAR